MNWHKDVVRIHCYICDSPKYTSDDNVQNPSSERDTDAS